MKKILYIFIAAFTAFSVTSCKRMGDTDGNLLNDMDANQGGLTGPRWLYQEESLTDTLTYSYNFLKMVKVATDSTNTQIAYNGDNINTITFNGFINTDSVSYIQNFNYDATGKLANITESRKTYPGGLTTTVNKSKSIYALKYNATTNKMDSIIAQSGPDVSTSTFLYTKYEKYGFTYDAADNVSKLTWKSGVVSSSGNFGPVIKYTNYDFTNYDTMKSPYTLLPWGYKLSRLFAKRDQGYIFSPNNPGRTVIVTDLTPVPTVVSTNYSYDPQTYALTGHGFTYIYKPF